MSELLADPRFWALVATGAVLSWVYTWNHLCGRDWRHPSGFLLGALVVAVFASGFALFAWRGVAVMLAVSLLGWAGTPLAAALARRR